MCSTDKLSHDDTLKFSREFDCIPRRYFSQDEEYGNHSRREKARTVGFSSPNEPPEGRATRAEKNCAQYVHKIKCEHIVHKLC